MVFPRTPRAGGAWLAAAVAASSAALSAYWALGGRHGVAMVGGPAQTMASGGSGAVLWVVVAVKAVGVLLPLSLVLPWGAAVPYRWRMAVTAAGAIVLTLYGAVLTGSAALVEVGAIRPSGVVDWTAIRWHLALWDPWFLVWGVCLGATWYQTRRRAVAMP